MKLPNKTYIVSGITAIILLALLSIKVSAQEVTQRSFTISPPAVQKALKPGDTAEGVMKVVNETTDPLTFSVSTQDYIVEDTQGTPVILPPDVLDRKYSAASWIGLDQSKITVPARSRVELSYYIQIPKDARPGGHYGAVVFKPESTITVEGTGTAVNTVIGTLFYLDVDGTITEYASVSKFVANMFQEYGPVKVMTQIHNAGDLHIRPQGTITITSPFGKKVSQKLVEANIFPGAARDFENEVGQKWMIGRYKAEFMGTYGKSNNNPLLATLYFWVFPWKVALIVILIIIAAILGIMYIKKRNGDTHTPPSSPLESNTNNTTV